MALSKIWVHAEAVDGKVANITLEMLAKARELGDTVECFYAVSYTHLTLPTNREV